MTHIRYFGRQMQKYETVISRFHFFEQNSRSVKHVDRNWSIKIIHVTIFYQVVTSLLQTRPGRKVQEICSQNTRTCQNAPKMRLKRHLGITDDVATTKNSMIIFGFQFWNKITDLTTSDPVTGQ